MKSEREIQADILISITSLPTAMFERMNTGAGRDATGRLVRFGTPGGPDIRGCLRGHAVAIECKTAKGQLRKDQKIWRDCFVRAGGTYIVGRDPQLVLRELEALP